MADDFEYDVFLSYSSKNKTIVRQVAYWLKADDLRVWFDDWVIKPGDSVPAKIDEGLENSRVLVLFMSAQAFGSDWAMLEAGTYRFRDPLNKERRFIPLRLDEAPIPGSTKQIRHIRWLPDDRNSMREYPKLLEACRPPSKPLAAEARAPRVQLLREHFRSKDRIMIAAMLYGAEDVRIQEHPIPEVGPGEVLVRIDRALTCGTDIKVFKRGYHAKMIQPPALFGHEWAGVVEEVDDGVTNFKPGDRVVAANSAPCDECFFCKRGQQELCEDLMFLNGAYAQFIKVPARIVEKNLLHVPDSLSLRDAALVEPLACVVKGAKWVSGIDERHTIAILGTGPIGLLFVAVVRELFLGRVVCIGRRSSRLQAALAMGASAIIDSDTESDFVEMVRRMTGGYGADTVIECVGTTYAWEQAIAMVRPGGTVHLFGGCPSGSKIELDTTHLHYNQVTLTSSFHHTPHDVRVALGLLENGVVPTGHLITAETSLGELPGLLAGGLRANGHVKVAIDPWK